MEMLGNQLMAEADPNDLEFIIDVVGLNEVVDSQSDLRSKIEYGESAAGEQNTVETSNLFNCRYLTFRYLKGMPLLVVV